MNHATVSVFQSGVPNIIPLTSYLLIMKLSFALLAATLLTTALAYQDVHQTSVQVMEVPDQKDTSSHFAIRVVRQDELMDESNHTTVAFKIAQVVLQFDVNHKTGQLALNDQPLEIGVSVVQVHGETVVGYDQLVTSHEQFEDQFDKGLMNVEISVQGFDVMHEGVMIRQLVVSERIVEVNGNILELTEVVQQIFEIKNGIVLKGIPQVVGSNNLLQGGTVLLNQSWQSLLLGYVIMTLVTLFFSGAIALFAFVAFYLARLFYRRAMGSTPVSLEKRDMDTEKMPHEIKNAYSELDNLPAYIQ